MQLDATLISRFDEALGVAVIYFEKDPPALVYAAGVPIEGSYEGFVGGIPIGDRAPSPEIERRFRTFSPRLQAFYRTVHDGWNQVMTGQLGPLHLSSMWFLGEYSSEADYFDGPAPFKLADMLNVVRIHEDGSALCLDLGMLGQDGSARAVIWHRSHEPPELDVDFWANLNGLIERGTQHYVLRPDQIRAGRRVRMLIHEFDGLEGTIVEAHSAKRVAFVEVSLFGGKRRLPADFLALGNPIGFQ